jgi:hypothetical protein
MWQCPTELLCNSKGLGPRGGYPIPGGYGPGAADLAPNIGYTRGVSARDTLDTSGITRGPPLAVSMLTGASQNLT